MRDLIKDMPNSAELTGWFTYLSIDDEVQVQRTAYAIVKAFNGNDKKAHANNRRAMEAEEIIDTTDPEFVKKFQGFTYGDKPQQNRVPQNTEIKIG